MKYLKRLDKTNYELGYTQGKLYKVVSTFDYNWEINDDNDNQTYITIGSSRWELIDDHQSKLPDWF